MTLEGSRKYWVMWLAMLAQVILAKFGPTWGGIFSTAIPYVIPTLAATTYYWWNYLQKKATDGFAPENWLSGKRTITGLILTVISPLIAQYSTESHDLIIQTVNLIADAATPALYMLFQAKSDIKLALPATVSTPATPASTPTYIPAPVEQPKSQIAIIEAANKASADAAASTTTNLVIQRKIAIRATVGTWEGAKQYLLGTFKDRWEASLRRMLMNNPNMATVDAVRQAVLEVLNVKMDDKVCEAISQTPGFLGAISAHSDIKIISDLLDVIDRTKELAYMKTMFTAIAVRYGIKNTLDDVVLRTQSSDMPTVKAAMLECGLNQWQIDKSQFSGGQIKMWYSTTGQIGTYQYEDFDVYRLAKVNPATMEDIV
jgi:hypothetical protein